MGSQSTNPDPPSAPPTTNPPTRKTLFSTVASTLYRDELLLAQAAVTSGRKTLLLTGGDADARRTIASLALPTAAHASCLLAGADGGRALLSLAASTSSPLILHDTDAPHASAALVALLDASPHRPLAATASTPAGVPADVRRAHRLDAHVRLRPPDEAARARAWSMLVPLVCGHTEKEEAGRLAEALAAAAPALGLADVVRAAGMHLASERPTDARADAAKFLASVAQTRPRRASLPFALAGVGAPLSDAWSLIGGYARQKAELLRAVSLTDARSLARLGARPPRGVLLHGPRGVGKTHLARAALAHARGTNSLVVSGPDLYSGFLGESERRVRALFAEARALAPCVVLIDDVDAVAGDRSREEAGGGTGVERRVLGALLAEMDGVAKGEEVALLACAEEVGAIDAAMMRPGRIDVVIEMPPPAEGDRRGILEAIMRDMPVEGRGETVEKVAKGTEGVCAAGLAGVCRRAAMLAMEEADEPDVVLQRHFLAAVSELSERQSPSHRNEEDSLPQTETKEPFT